MSERELPDSSDLGRVDDAAVVAAIRDCARAEAAAAARRLAAIAEFVARHSSGPGDRDSWSCDNWDAMAAEVAAAQGISHAMASGQMYLAMALRTRLPQVRTLLADGTISARLAAAIVWHTDLIKDPDVLRHVDAALADEAAGFGPLSVSRAAQAIDSIVDRHDPCALRRRRAGARGRHVTITPDNDQSGMAQLWGALLATDAALLDRRLTAVADELCDTDPRTRDQRRADALGTLAAGGHHLACACAQPDCPVALAPDPRAAAVTIHVVTEAAALDAAPDPHSDGERPAPTITAEMTLTQALAPDPEPDPPALLPAGHLIGGGLIPATAVAELRRGGAAVRRLRSPAALGPETSYRPSAALARFIRSRDMTCRFPGCDHPAEFADIDHTIAYPFGLTHPSNLKCLCRKHHLLKTFWPGWRDRQYPDGTIVWTSPTGHTYTTRPGSRLLFPALSLPTGELPLPPEGLAPQRTQRGVMMPTRRRTRAQDRVRRIDSERALNAAERSQLPIFRRRARC